MSNVSLSECERERRVFLLTDKWGKNKKQHWTSTHHFLYTIASFFDDFQTLFPFFFVFEHLVRFVDCWNRNIVVISMIRWQKRQSKLLYLRMPARLDRSSLDFYLDAQALRAKWCKKNKWRLDGSGELDFLHVDSVWRVLRTAWMDRFATPERRKKRWNARSWSHLHTSNGLRLK